MRRSMRRALRALPYAPGVLLVALLVVSAGCSGQAGELTAVSTSVSVAGGLLEDDYPTQRLLRIRFQGAAEKGSFRAILRLIGPESYQLSAVDPLGRALWGLEYEKPDLHFINYRQARECRTSGRTVISAIALETLPVGELPGILLGRLPATLARAHEGDDGLLIDDLGRQWSVSQVGAELDRWTLWEGGRPMLWFQRLESGGVLSHREGSQFRWRETLRETLAEVPPPLEVPEGVRVVACEAVAGSG